MGGPLGEKLGGAQVGEGGQVSDQQRKSGTTMGARFKQLRQQVLRVEQKSRLSGPMTAAATTHTAGSSSSGAASGRFDSLSGAFSIDMSMVVIVAAGFAML